MNSSENKEKSNDSSKEKELSNSQFLSDLSDGREKGDWKSKYDGSAKKCIIRERNILIIILFSTLLITFIVGLSYTDCIPYHFCNLEGLKFYVFSFFGGTLGGTLFSMKWLIHSVAKNSWNEDRHLWRMLTPIISSVTALMFALLINANIIPIESAKCTTVYKSFGIGALVGYFSDNAIGKLTEVALVLFGSSNAKSK